MPKKRGNIFTRFKHWLKLQGSILTTPDVATGSYVLGWFKYMLGGPAWLYSNVIDAWQSRYRKTIKFLSDLSLLDKFSNVFASYFLGFISKITGGDLHKKLFIKNGSPQGKTLAEADYSRSYTFKVVSNLFDVINYTQTIIKALGKFIFNGSRWQYYLKQKKILAILNKDNEVPEAENGAIHLQGVQPNHDLKNAVIEYGAASVNLIEVASTVDHYILAEALRDVYSMAMQSQGLKPKNLDKITKKYSDEIKKAKQDKCLSFYSESLDYLSSEHDALLEKRAKSARPGDSHLDTRFDILCSSIDLKTEARKAQLTLAILRDHPLRDEILATKPEIARDLEQKIRIFEERRQQLKREIVTLAHIINLLEIKGEAAVVDFSQEEQELYAKYRKSREPQQKKDSFEGGVKCLNKALEEFQLYQTYLNDEKDLKRGERLIDFGQSSDLKTTEYRLFKSVTIVASAIVVVNALVALLFVVSALSQFITTGNPQALIALAKEPSTPFTVARDWLISFSDGPVNAIVSNISTNKKLVVIKKQYALMFNSLGLNENKPIADLWKKLKDGKKTLEEAQKTYDDLKKNYFAKKIILEKKSAKKRPRLTQEYLDQKSAELEHLQMELIRAEELLHRKKQELNGIEGEVDQNDGLKKLLKLESRFSKLEEKNAKKSYSLSANLLVFFWGFVPLIYAFFPPSAVAAVVLLIAGYVVNNVPSLHNRYLSGEAKKRLKEEAQEFGLLPKNGDSAGKARSILFAIYTAWRLICRLTIEVPGTLILKGVEILNWVVSKAVGIKRWFANEPNHEPYELFSKQTRETMKRAFDVGYWITKLVVFVVRVIHSKLSGQNQNSGYAIKDPGDVEKSSYFYMQEFTESTSSLQERMQTFIQKIGNEELTQAEALAEGAKIEKELDVLTRECPRFQYLNRKATGQFAFFKKIIEGDGANPELKEKVEAFETKKREYDEVMDELRNPIIII